MNREDIMSLIKEIGSKSENTAIYLNLWTNAEISSTAKKRDIQLAETSDLEQIASIYDKSFGTTTDMQKMVQIFKHVSKDPNYYAIICKEGSVVKGFAMLTVIEDMFNSSNSYATLRNVCVAPEYRRQGVARKIIEQVEHVLDMRRCVFVVLITDTSRIYLRDLYRRNGFVFSE